MNIMVEPEKYSEQNSYKKCAVFSCKSKSKLILSFPDPNKNNKKYQDWLLFCNNKILQTMRPDDVLKSYGVCESHFAKKTVTLHEQVPTMYSTPSEESHHPQKSDSNWKPIPREKIDIVKEDAYEPSQLCRLCFNIGSINLFKCKYYQKTLRDIVKIFIPIEIESSDVSTMICGSCKSEIIRFYNFFIKSLQVDNYFRVIAKETLISQLEDPDDISLFEPLLPLLDIDSEAEHSASLIKIEDTDDFLLLDDLAIKTEVDDNIPSESSATININEIPSTSSSYTIECNQIPEPNDYKVSKAMLKIIEDFHNYARNPNKKRVVVKKVSQLDSPKNHLPDETSSNNQTEHPDPVNNVDLTEDCSNNETSAKDKIVPETEGNGDSTMICMYCKKTIKSLDKFNEHCKLENHAPYYSCSRCHKMFTSSIDLEEHLHTHQKSGIICDRCGKKFMKRDSLENHLILKHGIGEKKFVCEICSKPFVSKAGLKRHTIRHARGKPFCCEICGSVYTSLGNLKYHQVIHTDNKPFVCSICNKAFHRKYKLNIHMTMHSNERKFFCEICGVSYKRRLNLYRHRKKNHQNPKEDHDAKFKNPRTCQHCDFTCSFPKELRWHTLKYHRTYTCSVCNASFKSYQSYYNHYFKHNPHKMKCLCTYCGKRFINTSLLNIHMVVHTGKKRFECGVCGKRFAQQPHLKSHMLTHTGERPHQCKFCAKRFAHLTSLVVHERIHTGETPYVCKHCNKGFGHLTNLKKHVYTQHGIITPNKKYKVEMRIPDETRSTLDTSKQQIDESASVEYVNANKVEDSDCDDSVS